ncbi:MAG TPA: GxxExxY protein [bacterium]|nr:GxxExxY protein [bacterium]
MSPAEREELNAITEKIIGCAYRVANGLGAGFLEKVYENALTYEMGKAGLNVERQVKLEVRYEKIIVGEFIADLLVESKVLVEIKAVKLLNDAQIAQGMNYLRATGLSVCLLINFGKSKIDIKRLVNNF